nr:aldose epimerase family protein [Pedobacter glucosidilyticus]
MKMNILKISFMALLASLIYACQQHKTTQNSTPEQLPHYAAAFDTLIDGKEVKCYQLINKNNMKAVFTNYGGRLVSLLIPTQDTSFVDVVVGFKSIDDYITSTEPYFGATIGRYGNRIAKGKFSIDGVNYQLAINNPPNSLHGGKKGFQYVVWDAKQIDNQTLELSYLSPDMEEGYPGNLAVKVIYKLNDDNELMMQYEASTDKKTVVNLTNHAFFNLNGEGSGDILNHQLQINAKAFTPVDSTLIPTGEIALVKNTPFDFTELTTIGASINLPDEQLKNGKGYDHNYVLQSKPSEKMILAAKVIGNKTSITMEVFTTEPGLQFYSGNFMMSKNIFKSGARDDFRTAFCLETQHFPDSPNQPAFPSTLLKPGELYKTQSKYRFSW